MEYIPVALFWLLAIWAFMSRGPMLLYMFFGSISLGSFAVVPTALTAGLTFGATPILSLLIIGRVLLLPGSADHFLTNALRFNRLGLLTCFWVVAIVTTAFLPFVFAEKVFVVPVRDVREGVQLLQPTPQNISQLAYISISILSVFAFSRMLQSRADRQLALKALVFGAAVAVVTGLIDFASQYLPLTPLLDLFRTASYAIADDVEVFGSKRVVGLMPEASAYGGVVLGFLSSLVFFRRAMINARLRKFYTPVVILLLALLIYLSKSSGAYLGAVVLAVAFGFETLLRAFTGGGARQMHRQDLIGELGLTLLLFVMAIIVVMFVPAVTESVYAIVDRMLLNKTESGSFEERGLWRSTALETVFSSYGLGIGLGSTRASSSLVAILSGTGILGGLLFVAFLLQTLMRKASHLDWEGQFILAGFRFSFVPAFVVSLMVGDADFGALQAFGFGIVTAVAFSRSSQLALRNERHLATLRRMHKEQKLLGYQPSGT